MAIFKFRKKSEDAPITSKPQETIEMMRKRAKFRLIGALVLVLLAVVGFPWLFDQQPRLIDVNLPISIPDKNKAIPSVQGVISKPVLNITSPIIPETSQVQGKTLQEPSIPITDNPPPANLSPKPVEKESLKGSIKVKEIAPESMPIKPVAQKIGVNSTESNRAVALLNDKPVAKEQDIPVARYVVQVGAFAEQAGARAVRLKLEIAGFKTYTQVAKTKDGDRIRVRVGPFSDKETAIQAQEKIKTLNLPAAVLTL